MKPIQPQAKICVHSGLFHADEVFSIATMSIIEPTIQVTRSREEKVWKDSDFRVDVGGKYDPETGDFDHHQLGFTERHPAPGPKYETGPKKSSIGLIWDAYGEQAIRKLLLRYDPKLDDEGIFFIHMQITRTLIAPIDAADNGEAKDFYMDSGAYRSPSIVNLIQNLNPTWMEKDTSADDSFLDAVKFAINYLSREIVRNISVYSGRFKLLEKVKNVDSSGILELEEFVPWAPIFNKYPEETQDIKMVIFPSNGIWMVQSPYYNWRTDADKFSAYTVDGKKRKQRYPAPAAICGATNDVLVDLTKVEDAVFVHATGFIAAARSLEGARQLAHYIMNNQK